MGKFCQFLTELSARDMSIFSFLDNKLSKWQWIFTKLGVWIYILEIWFGIANRQISLTFDRFICSRHDNGGVSSDYVSIMYKYMYLSRKARKRIPSYSASNEDSIIMRIRAVWSESSLSEWRSVASLAIQNAPSENSECASWSVSSLSAHVRKNVTCRFGSFDDYHINRRYSDRHT